MTDRDSARIGHEGRRPSDSPRDLVKTGYDQIGSRYRQWSESIIGDPRERFLTDLLLRLSPAAEVLDLGCGSGIPSTEKLATQCIVTGVDFSEEQLRLARRCVPTATFVCADAMTVTFADASFDAVTAFYSITHIPKSEQGALFSKIARWLRPGGWLLASLGATGSDDWSGEWLGVPMFFSSHDADTNRRLLHGSGFTLDIDETVTMDEPDGPVTFQWVLAQRQ